MLQIYKNRAFPLRKQPIISLNKQILHFWELSNECRFWLDARFWKRVYVYKKQNFRSWKEFSQELGIGYGTLTNYLSQKNNSRKAQFVPVSILCRISNLSFLPFRKVEKYIRLTKYGKNGKAIALKLPINLLAKDWAALVGAILSEGSISKRAGVSFWNKDKEIIDKFMNLTEKVIPKGAYLHKCRDAYCCILPQIIAQIFLLKLDAHVGSKVISNPRIPNIYMNLHLSSNENRDIVGNLLSWLFTGDGWISLFKDNRGRTQRHMGIGFSILSKNEPPQLLEDVHNLIQKFGIHPQNLYFSHKISYFKNGKERTTEAWKFFIHGKENFERFQKFIDFQDTRRKEILQASIESFIKPNLRKGEPIIKIVSAVIKLAPCTKHFVAKETRLQTKRVETLFKNAKDKGLVEIIGGGERLGCYGRKPYIYGVTMKGISFIKKNGGKFS